MFSVAQELMSKRTSRDQSVAIAELPKNDLWGVGEPRKLAVDVGNAGTGALSVVPMREHEVEWWIERVEGGLYYVTLKPLITGPHTVFLFYGGREIPNGAISFEVTFRLFHRPEDFYSR